MVSIKSRSIKGIYEDDEQPQVDSQNKDTEQETSSQNDSKFSALQDQLNQLAKIKADAKKVYDTERQTAQSNINTLKASSDKMDKAELGTKLVTLYNTIRTSKTKYEDAVKQIENNMIAINKEIAALGGDVQDSIVESLKTRFINNLCESVSDTNKAAILSEIIYDAFGDVSYHPTKTQCRTIARNAYGWINKNEWSRGDDHWNDLEGYLLDVFERGRRNIPLISSERLDVIENIRKGLSRNSVFAYIVFGRDEVDDDIVDEEYELDDQSDRWTIDNVGDDIMDMVEWEFESDVNDGMIEIDREGGRIFVNGPESYAEEIGEFVEENENK